MIPNDITIRAFKYTRPPAKQFLTFNERINYSLLEFMNEEGIDKDFKGVE